MVYRVTAYIAVPWNEKVLLEKCHIPHSFSPYKDWKETVNICIFCLFFFFWFPSACWVQVCSPPCDMPSSPCLVCVGCCGGWVVMTPWWLSTGPPSKVSLHAVPVNSCKATPCLHANRHKSTPPVRGIKMALVSQSDRGGSTLPGHFVWVPEGKREEFWNTLKLNLKVWKFETEDV